MLNSKGFMAPFGKIVNAQTKAFEFQEEKEIEGKKEKDTHTKLSMTEREILTEMGELDQIMEIEKRSKKEIQNETTSE
jgi:hypothetical protein